MLRFIPQHKILAREAIIGNSLVEWLFRVQEEMFTDALSTMYEGK